jgi:hypothetical protein
MRAIGAIAVALVALPLHAQGGFAPLPAVQGRALTGLEIRVLGYQGGVNGVLTAEVHNPTGAPIEFVARGLYFVPDGNANNAPQRVGAVGAFMLQTAKGWEQRVQATIDAGATARMKLDVFCIDSHRASPSSMTGFRPAAQRLPKPMADKIDSDTKERTRHMGGQNAAAAKSAVQSEVWKNRNEHWVPLDGEGNQEASKR